MNLSADSVTGADGPNLVPFSENFYYVQTQLQVTGTSPAVGSVLTVPDTDQTDLVVQFNKAFNPTTINTSDFQVSQGSVVSAVPLTSQSVDLTLSGITQDGSLTLTVPFGVILDTLGVPNAVFTGNYIVDIVSEPYPTPLQGQDPAGSLIYDPSVSGTIGFAGNTDTFTLPLAAGQTLSLVMTTAPGLIGTVTLLDPNDNVIGTATGSGPAPPWSSRRCRSRPREPTRSWPAGRAPRRQLHPPGDSERRLQAGDRQYQHDWHGLRPDHTSRAWARRPPRTEPE